MAKLILRPDDLTNKPSILIIGGVTLPNDTVPYLNGSKVIVKDNILDGVAVTERIQRNPYELEFEGILRQYTDTGYINSDGSNTIFPQEILDDLWQKVWEPDGVQKVQNTMLNKLGITEMIVEKVTVTPFRGSKDINIRISGYENVPGETLILA